MNINENIRNDWKKTGKIIGYAYKITTLSLTDCPRILNMIAKYCYDIVL